jgi:threonyl-tRNA synthetase
MRILPVTDRVMAYAEKLRDIFFQAGIRIELDERSEKIGHKIREAELAKVPIMLIIGDREAEAGKVSVRRRGMGDLGTMKAEALLEAVSKEIRMRANAPLPDTFKKEELV